MRQEQTMSQQILAYYSAVSSFFFRSITFVVFMHFKCKIIKVKSLLSFKFKVQKNLNVK